MKLNVFYVKSNLYLLVLNLFLILVRESYSVEFSIAHLQKCEENRLIDQERELKLPDFLSSTNEDIKFRITEKCGSGLPHCKHSCPSPMTQLSIPLILPQEPPPQPQNFSEDYQQPDDDFYIPYHFTPKGYFRYDNEYFSPDDFCLYAHQHNQLVIKICPSICEGSIEEAASSDDYDLIEPILRTKSEDHQERSISIRDISPNSFQVCVPKCCSIHKVIDLHGNVSCKETQSSVPWEPLVYRSASRQICGEKRTNLKLHYFNSPPSCESFDKYFLRPDIPNTTRVRFRLLTNGTVLLRELGDSQWTVLEEGTYCLDGVQGYGPNPKLYNGDPLDQILLVCDMAGKQQAQDEKDFMAGNISKSSENMKKMEMKWRNSKEDRLNATGISYIILLFSGVPFLLITAIVYVLVWTKQNVHGWTQFSHVLAVLLHYLAQAVANTVSRVFNSDQNASSICRIVGVTNHFFVLASFCWLTVINYDLFSMFRRLKTTVGRSRGLKRFLVYMSLAWGLPLIVVTISVTLDKLYGLFGDDGDCEVDVIVPLYGHRTCYMSEDARPYYLFYPVGFLMILNMLLAGMTFVNMYKHDQSAKMVSEKSTKHRRKFAILAKLFVVMGLVWIFEMFVWLFIKEGETLPWYLVFPDVFNFLQAVAIFSLFACQPKILNQVEESYPKLKRITEILKKLSCNKNNSTKTSSKSNTNTQTTNLSRSHSLHKKINNNSNVSFAKDGIDQVKISTGSIQAPTKKAKEEGLI